MSKNTGTSELINYFDLGVNGDVGIAGSLDINTIANATTDTDTFLVSDTGIIKYRTGAELLSDIGAAPAVAGGYLPLTGGILTGTTRMDGSGGTAPAITMIFNSGINRLLAPLLRLYGATNESSNYIELFGTLATSNRTINFPDASGTVALTSNLSGYLPLTGGTLTGALNGTTANFSGNVTMGGNDGAATRLYVRTEDTANTPSLTLFKNVSSGSAEDIFRVQSWNGAFNTVASIRANGSANFLSSVSATSLRSSTVGTFGFNTASNGEFQIYSTAESGLVMAGRGSSFDMVITNKNGADTIRIPTGTTNVNFVGNVGIGTASPVNKLSVLVDGGGADDGIRIGVGSQGDGIKIVQRYLSDRVVATLGQSNYGVVTDSGALRLYDVAGTETVRLSGKNSFPSFITSGNVMIGTPTDTGYKLYVNGIAGFSSSVTANNYISNQEGINVSNYGFLSQTLSGQMTIIGHNLRASTSVNNQVDVVNGGWFSSMIRMYYSDGITFHTSNNIYAAGAVYPMAALEVMRIAINGNVGIGTSNPTSKFQVSGTNVPAAIYSDNNSLCLGLGYQGVLSGYVGGISSALYAYSTNGGYVLLNSSSVWVAASDVKRKRNFEPYTKGLSAILGLQPKLYNMDFQEDGDEKQVGLVAQEVREFIPLAYEENNDFIGLNYNAIIVTMVKAIQEQQQQIQELKNKLS